MKQIVLLLTLMTCGQQAYAEDPYSKLAAACLHKDSKIDVCDQLANIKLTTETVIQNKLVQWGLLNTSIVLGSLIKSAIDQKIEISDKTHTILVLGNERKIVLKRDEVSLVFVWSIP
jgi:hypothetical protein